MAKNTIELKGKAASDFFRAVMEQRKPITDRLEAAGFEQKNSPNEWRAKLIKGGIGYGLVCVINESRLSPPVSAWLFMKIGGNEDCQPLPEVKTVDDILTLARLLGLSKEVE